MPLKSIFVKFLPILAFTVFSTALCFSQSAGKEYYQLKKYVFNSADQASVTDHYLKEAYLPALHRRGITLVGVFKDRPEEGDSLMHTYVLLPFASIEDFLSLDEELQADKEYLTKGKSYLKATHDAPPYIRIESTLMVAFDEMPHMIKPDVDGPRSQRIYELRSYESPTEEYYKRKVHMFNEGGEVALFDKLTFNPVFFADVISGAHMPNLVYMTTFPNMESRDAHWKAFVDSPEWKAMNSLPEYSNTVSHAEIMLLYPTKYSDY